MLIPVAGPSGQPGQRAQQLVVAGQLIAIDTTLVLASKKSKQ